MNEIETSQTADAGVNETTEAAATTEQAVEAVHTDAETASTDAVVETAAEHAEPKQAVEAPADDWMTVPAAHARFKDSPGTSTIKVKTDDGRIGYLNRGGDFHAAAGE